MPSIEIHEYYVKGYEERGRYLEKINSALHAYMEGDLLERGLQLLEIRQILIEAGYE